MLFAVPFFLTLAAVSLTFPRCSAAPCTGLHSQSPPIILLSSNALVVVENCDADLSGPLIVAPNPLSVGNEIVNSSLLLRGVNAFAIHFSNFSATPLRRARVSIQNCMVASGIVFGSNDDLLVPEEATSSEIINTPHLELRENTVVELINVGHMASHAQADHRLLHVNRVAFKNSSSLTVQDTRWSSIPSASACDAAVVLLTMSNITQDSVVRLLNVTISLVFDGAESPTQSQSPSASCSVVSIKLRRVAITERSIFILNSTSLHATTKGWAAISELAALSMDNQSSITATSHILVERTKLDIYGAHHQSNSTNVSLLVAAVASAMQHWAPTLSHGSHATLTLHSCTVNVISNVAQQRPTGTVAVLHITPRFVDGSWTEDVLPLRSTHLLLRNEFSVSGPPCSTVAVVDVSPTRFVDESSATDTVVVESQIRNNTIRIGVATKQQHICECSEIVESARFVAIVAPLSFRGRVSVADSQVRITGNTITLFSEVHEVPMNIAMVLAALSGVSLTNFSLNVGDCNLRGPDNGARLSSGAVVSMCDAVTVVAASVRLENVTASRKGASGILSICDDSLALGQSRGNELMPSNVTQLNVTVSESIFNSTSGEIHTANGVEAIWPHTIIYLPGFSANASLAALQFASQLILILADNRFDGFSRLLLEADRSMRFSVDAALSEVKTYCNIYKECDPPSSPSLLSSLPWASAFDDPESPQVPSAEFRFRYIDRATILNDVENTTSAQSLSGSLRFENPARSLSNPDRGCLQVLPCESSVYLMTNASKVLHKCTDAKVTPVFIFASSTRGTSLVISESLIESLLVSVRVDQRDSMNISVVSTNMTGTFYMYDDRAQSRLGLAPQLIGHRFFMKDLHFINTANALMLLHLSDLRGHYLIKDCVSSSTNTSTFLVVTFALFRDTAFTILRVTQTSSATGSAAAPLRINPQWLLDSTVSVDNCTFLRHGRGSVVGGMMSTTSHIVGVNFSITNVQAVLSGTSVFILNFAGSSEFSQAINIFISNCTLAAKAEQIVLLQSTRTTLDRATIAISQTTYVAHDVERPLAIFLFLRHCRQCHVALENSSMGMSCGESSNRSDCRASGIYFFFSQGLQRSVIEITDCDLRADINDSAASMSSIFLQGVISQTQISIMGLGSSLMNFGASGQVSAFFRASGTTRIENVTLAIDASNISVRSDNFAFAHLAMNSDICVGEIFLTVTSSSIGLSSPSQVPSSTRSSSFFAVDRAAFCASDEVQLNLSISLSTVVIDASADHVVVFVLPNSSDSASLALAFKETEFTVNNTGAAVSFIEAFGNIKAHVQFDAVSLNISVGIFAASTTEVYAWFLSALPTSVLNQSIIEASGSRFTVNDQSSIHRITDGSGSGGVAIHRIQGKAVHTVLKFENCSLNLRSIGGCRWFQFIESADFVNVTVIIMESEVLCDCSESFLIFANTSSTWSKANFTVSSVVQRSLSPTAVHCVGFLLSGLAEYHSVVVQLVKYSLLHGMTKKATLLAWESPHQLLLDRWTVLLHDIEVQSGLNSAGEEAVNIEVLSGRNATLANSTLRLDGIRMFSLAQKTKLFSLREIKWNQSVATIHHVAVYMTINSSDVIAEALVGVQSTSLAMSLSDIVVVLHFLGNGPWGVSSFLSATMLAFSTPTHLNVSASNVSLSSKASPFERHLTTFASVTVDRTPCERYGCNAVHIFVHLQNVRLTVEVASRPEVLGDAASEDMSLLAFQAKNPPTAQKESPASSHDEGTIDICLASCHVVLNGTTSVALMKLLDILGTSPVTALSITDSTFAFASPRSAESNFTVLSVWEQQRHANNDFRVSLVIRRSVFSLPANLGIIATTGVNAPLTDVRLTCAWVAVIGLEETSMLSNETRTPIPREAFQSPLGSFFRDRVDVAFGVKQLCVVKSPTTSTTLTFSRSSSSSSSASRSSTNLISHSETQGSQSTTSTRTGTESNDRTLTMTSHTASESLTSSYSRSASTSLLCETSVLILPVLTTMVSVRSNDGLLPVNITSMLLSGQSGEVRANVFVAATNVLSAAIESSWGPVSRIEWISPRNVLVTFSSISPAAELTIFSDRAVSVRVRAAAFSCPPTQATYDVTFRLVRHPAILDPQVNDAIQIVSAATTTVSGFLTTPMMGMQQSRAAVLLSQQLCVSAPYERLDFSDSPLQLALGPPHHGYVRGALLGNGLLTFGFLILASCLTFFFYDPRKEHRTVWGAMGILHLPGALIVPITELLQGTAMSATTLIVHGHGSFDITMAICALVIVVVIVGFVVQKTTVGLRCRIVERVEVQDPEFGVVQTILFWMFLSSQKWVDVEADDLQPPGYSFKQHYMHLFYDFKAHCPWFLAFEMLVSIAIGVLAGLKKEESCSTVLMIFTSILGIQTASALLFRPYIAPADATVHIAVTCTTFLSAGLYALAVALEEESLLKASAVFALMALIFTSVKMIIDLLFLGRWFISRYRTLQRKRQQQRMAALRESIEGADEEELDRSVRCVRVMSNDEVEEAARPLKANSLGVATCKVDSNVINDDEQVGADFEEMCLAVENIVIRARNCCLCCLPATGTTETPAESHSHAQEGDGGCVTDSDAAEHPSGRFPPYMESLFEQLLDEARANAHIERCKRGVLHVCPLSTDDVEGGAGELLLSQTTAQGEARSKYNMPEESVHSVIQTLRRDRRVSLRLRAIGHVPSQQDEAELLDFLRSLVRSREKEQLHSGSSRQLPPRLSSDSIEPHFLGVNSQCDAENCGREGQLSRGPRSGGSIFLKGTSPSQKRSLLQKLARTLESLTDDNFRLRSEVREADEDVAMVAREHVCGLSVSEIVSATHFRTAEEQLKLLVEQICAARKVCDGAPVN